MGVWVSHLQLFTRRESFPGSLPTGSVSRHCNLLVPMSASDLHCNQVSIAASIFPPKWPHLRPSHCGRLASVPYFELLHGYQHLRTASGPHYYPCAPRQVPYIPLSTPSACEHERRLSAHPTGLHLLSSFTHLHKLPPCPTTAPLVTHSLSRSCALQLPHTSHGSIHHTQGSS